MQIQKYSITGWVERRITSSPGLIGRFHENLLISSSSIFLRWQYLVSIPSYALCMSERVLTTSAWVSKCGEIMWHVMCLYPDKPSPQSVPSLQQSRPLVRLTLLVGLFRLLRRYTCRMLLQGRRTPLESLFRFEHDYYGSCQVACEWEQSQED